MAGKKTTDEQDTQGETPEATEATQGETEASQGEDTQEGLAGTGNPLDMSTPNEDRTGTSVDAGVHHQEGAPADMVAAVEESERLGYIAPEQNALKAEKPDYTQRNPQVMNQGSEG